MKHIIKKLVGSTDRMLFEQMLYHGICILTIIGSIAITIFNISNHWYVFAIFTSTEILLCSVLYYLARFKKRYYFIGLYFFSALIMMIDYFYGYGIFGSLPYYLMVTLVLALAYTPLKKHITILSIQLTILFAMFLIEYLFPQLVINPYATKEALHADFIVGIMFCTLMSFFGIYFLRKSYDNEKEKTRLQKELLEKNSEQKSMFFINLSHEIKTPLTLVENYLWKYIERKGEDEELVIIRQNIQKMRRDILDYLNFENIERGGISFDKLDVFSLDKFLEGKIKLFDSYAKNKNISLICQMDFNVYIKTNTKGIDQVLNNLLENAVKYTPENGKINVWLRNEKDYVELKIQNTGATIPEEQIPHLFEPFYQLSREKLNAQGLGMGLYTVKKILDNVGGKIEVNSNKESGVVFTVSLPAGAKTEAIEPPVIDPIIPIINTVMPPAADSPYSINKPCLLIVEDHNDLLSYLVSELQKDYNVFVANNGLIAIERLKTIPVPELIISDIMMDQMDGYELLERTLNDEKFAHIPFIFLTAKNEPKEKAASFEKGVLDFITKPFSIDELKMKIKAIIEQKTRISEAAVYNLKKQFSDNHFSLVKQKQTDILNTNALRFNLTPREKEVVVLVKQGLKYEEIGERLHISEHTVNRHIQNIYEKTNSSSKLELLDKVFKQI